MVDIGMVRAVHPDVAITEAKVADARAAIKQGSVQVSVGGEMKVAAPGDMDDLGDAAKQRAKDELEHNRAKVQEIVRASTSPPLLDEAQRAAR